MQRDWLETFREGLATARLPVPCARLLVAVSGGPDSVCLLELVTRWRRERADPPVVFVGHVHHGLRGAEADVDAEFVRVLAQQRGFEFLLSRVDVPAVARQQRLSPEAAARQVRYAAFRSWAAEHRLDAVVLAHHFDDQAETVLMRAIRGGGPRGLGGVPTHRVLSHAAGVTAIARPLLSWRRDEIKACLDDFGLTARHDSSNDDVLMTRNRLRRDVLPALESAQPGATVSLGRLGARMQKLQSDLVAVAGEVLRAATIESSPQGVTLCARQLVRWPSTLVREAILLAAQGILERGGAQPESVCSLRLTQPTIDEVMVWLQSCRAEGRVGAAESSPRRFALGADVGLDLRYGRLHVALEEPTGRRGASPAPRLSLFESASSAARSTAATSRVVWRDWRFRCDERSAASDSQRTALRPPWREHEANPLVELFDADRLEALGPLAVRSRSRGDRFQPLGAAGRQKLKEFFRQRRVLPGARDAVPLVMAGDTIVWVVGHRIGAAACCTQETQRVVRVEAVRGATKARWVDL